jgi:hypothetical protein
MKQKSYLYLILALLGLVLTWTFNIQYIMQGGSLMPGAFWQAITPTIITTSIALDVTLAAVVFSIWVWRDAQTSGVSKPWLYIVLTFCVGLSVAWPLYLHVKQNGVQD